MAKVFEWSLENDNTKIIKQAAQEAIARALEDVGMQAADYAADLAPVDTGLLHNSITYALAGEAPAITSYKADTGPGKGSYSRVAPKDPEGQNSVYVGTNVQYAVYQEMGTSGMDAQPFLRPAIQNHLDEYKRMIEEDLKNA